MPMTNSDARKRRQPSCEALADVLAAAATAIRQGHPAISVNASTAGDVFVVAHPISAARWRATYGQELAGVPLHVFEWQQVTA